MDKIAQKRNPFHKIREKVDIFGRGAEAFSPTFSKLMDTLRETDDGIRDTLLNTDVSIKDLLKSAKSNFNRRLYMDAIIDLKKFHDRIAPVIEKLEKLELKIDEAHHEFIFGDLSEETSKGLRELSDKFKNMPTPPKKAESSYNLIKEAFLGDLWHLLTNDKAKALKHWERGYPTKMKELKQGANSLIRQSEHVFKTLLLSLKEMSSARAARNIDRYVKASKKLVDRYKSYNVDFSTFFNTHVKDYLEKQEKSKQQEQVGKSKEVETEDTDLGSQEVSRPFAPSPGEMSRAPSTKPSATPDMSKPESSAPITGPPAPRSTLPSPQMPTKERPTVPVQIVDTKLPGPPKVPSDLAKMVEEQAPATISEEATPTVGEPATLRGDADTIPARKSNHRLINSLKVLSKEDPKILALEIHKYAKSIESTDPVTSSKLMNIVGKILNGK